MNLSIPSMSRVRAVLRSRSTPDLKAAAEAAGYSWTTVWRITNGETPNPGLDTVRKLLSHLPKAAA